MKNIHSEFLPPDYITREAQLRRMKKLIREQLTPMQQETLCAYYFHHKTIEQIANERGVQKSTVCRTLHRAMEKLGKFLKY